MAEGRAGRRGRANLCAYFLLRMAAISRFSGLVCTESIGQGDSREVGLDALDEAGRIIYRAEPSTEWPGSAAVRIAKLWLSSERFERSVLNGLEVERINSRLEAGDFQPELPTWKEAEDLFFMGSVPNGDGFILDADEAARLVGEDPINSEVVRPFLTGKDVTDQPTPVPRRFIINFRDLDLHSAALFARPFQIVSERVRPERLKGGSSGWRARIAKYWWRFHTFSPSIYQACECLSSVIVLPLNSKHVFPARAEASFVYGHSLGVLVRQDHAPFAVLASSLHREWARFQGSKMPSGTIQYRPGAVFSTFPAPWSRLSQRLEDLGLELESRIGELAGANDWSQTAVLNVVNDPAIDRQEIVGIRQVVEDIDFALCENLGLEIGITHEFVEDGDAFRYSLSAKSWAEIRAALIQLVVSGQGAEP